MRVSRSAALLLFFRHFRDVKQNFSEKLGSQEVVVDRGFKIEWMEEATGKKKKNPKPSTNITLIASWNMNGQMHMQVQLPPHFEGQQQSPMPIQDLQPTFQGWQHSPQGQ